MTDIDNRATQKAKERTETWTQGQATHLNDPKLRLGLLNHSGKLHQKNTLDFLDRIIRLWEMHFPTTHIPKTLSVDLIIPSQETLPHKLIHRAM